MSNLIILNVRNFCIDDVYDSIENIKPILKNNEFIIADLNDKRRYKKNFIQNYKIVKKSIKDIIISYDYTNINNVLILDVGNNYNIKELKDILNKEYEENILYSYNLFKDKYKEIYDIFNNSFEVIIFNSKFKKHNKLKNTLDLRLIENTLISKDISILIPVYNVEFTIKRCLDSCLNQTFKGSYEIVIVDDGSTDNTVNIIKSYKDNRIKLFYKNHSGISDTMNYGLSKCKGIYICRMDADDEMYDYRLKYQYDYILKHPEIDVLCNNIDRYLYKDNKFTPYNYSKNIEIVKQNITIRDLFDKKNNYNFICHPAIFFKKELYNHILEEGDVFYDPEYDGAEDYELYCRLIKKYSANITSDKISVLKYSVIEKSKEKSNLINYLRNKLYHKYDYEDFSNLTLGIYYIATGKYKNDFKRFLISLKNLMPDNEKTVVLISDGLREYDGYIDGENKIKVIVKNIPDYPWPINTLFKMKYIYDNIINVDYVFYFNANAEILPIKSYEWFDKDNLIFAYHKDWFHNKCNTYVFCEPYMDNPNSTSYIGTTNYIYIQGAFFGGPTKELYKMCEEIDHMIMIDLQNNIIPRYHDETYLNKYNYLYNNGLISNVLISEIWYNKNDLSNIESTQFILLNENVYKESLNNKANKFDYVINHECLKPLYNFKDPYKFKKVYPSYYINKEHKGKNLIIIFIKGDCLNNVEDVVNKIKKLQEKFDVICLNDRNLDKFTLDNLYQIFDSEHIFSVNLTYVLGIKKNISTNNLDFELSQINNLIFTSDYWFNQIDKYDFKHLYFINDIDAFFSNPDIIYDYENKEGDLLVYEYYKHNIYEFTNNFYTKNFDLFKYKYKYKDQYFCDIKNHRISHNAFEFLYKFKDPTKHTISQYYMPTLLCNNGYSIKKYNE